MNKYILYCIFSAREGRSSTALSGVNNQPVVIVAISSLAAAASAISHAETLPDPTRLLAYKRVVDCLHLHRTVIPMRYGCILNGKRQVQCLLRANAGHYEALLEELKGCVEMGIRILIPQHDTKEDENGTPRSATDISGTEFLAARRVFYAQQEVSSEKVRRIILDCRDRLAGLWVKCRSVWRQA